MPSVSNRPEVQRIGSILPDLELPLLSGGTRTLQSFLDGKRGGVFVIWSGVCSHCIRYDEYLNGFSERHPDFAFAVIASRDGETAPELQKTADERKLRFPILHSADALAATLLYAEQTPRVYLVDASRALLYRGAIDNFKYPEDPGYDAYLEPAIADFQAGRPIARPDKPSFGCAVRTVYYMLPRKMV